MAAAAFTLLAAVHSAPVQATDFWVQATPIDAAEAALRAALPAAGAAPVSALPALRDVSTAHPGTVPSGLAQLTIGLVLLDANRPLEAVAPLSHPDVARTALADHGLLARARAYEAIGRWVEAGRDHLALVASYPESPLLCPALVRGAEAVQRIGSVPDSIPLLSRAERECPDDRAAALLALGRAHESMKDPRAAAAAYEKLDRDFAGSPEAREAEKSLGRLGSVLPPRAPAQGASRELQRAAALADAGHYREAVATLRKLGVRGLSPEEADLARVRLGRALLVLNKDREASQALAAVSKGSPLEPEAAFHLAKIQARRTRSPIAYERVADSFPGTPWGEEALLSLAYHYQKDGRDEPALPYYKRLWLEYPEGRYVERALWRVCFADYRAGRYAEAADALESAARKRSESLWTGGFLYWAGRARQQLGQTDRAR
ncbi:MAG TPA: tetratricopeptide repeat protein, partial [Vicinamibacteria bacterium]